MHRSLLGVCAILAFLVATLPVKADEVVTTSYESMSKAELLEALAAKPKSELVRLLAAADARTATGDVPPVQSSPDRATRSHAPNKYLLLAGSMIAGYALASAMSHRAVNSGAPGGALLQTASTRRVLDATSTTAACNTAASFTNCQAYPLHQVTCNLFAGLTSASSLSVFGIDTTPAGTPTSAPVPASGASPVAATVVTDANLARANSQRNVAAYVGLGLHIAQIAANCTNGQPALQ